MYLQIHLAHSHNKNTHTYILCIYTINIHTYIHTCMKNVPGKSEYSTNKRTDGQTDLQTKICIQKAHVSWLPEFEGGGGGSEHQAYIHTSTQSRSGRRRNDECVEIIKTQRIQSLTQSQLFVYWSVRPSVYLTVFLIFRINKTGGITKPWEEPQPSSLPYCLPDNKQVIDINGKNNTKRKKTLLYVFKP